MLGNVVTLHAGDEETDPGELAILERMGATTLLMAGTSEVSGRGWLLEIFGDAMSAPVADFAIPLRGLMAIAVLEAARS